MAMSESFHIGMEINMLSNLIHREIDRSIAKNAPELAKENVTGVNGRVIGFLSAHADQDIFQKDIEEVLRIRRSTASTLLKGMEEKGYIHRESVAFDARLKKLVLTEKAINMQRKIIGDIERFENELRAGITDAELVVFESVIHKIRENLHS
ncbi:MAG: MarR family winged helix-turn-helix transcriptional regulator [Lachnospiraceae bacterium]